MARALVADIGRGKLRGMAIAAMSIAMYGCSSIHSVENPTADAGDGLKYFMPKKDFLVTVTVSQKKVTNVVFSTTSNYPDYAHKYVLRYGGNVFGKNTLDIVVNEAGLLASAKSTTESAVADVFKGLASAAGYASAFRTFGGDVKGASQPPLPECKVDGTHIFILERPIEDKEVCGVRMRIRLRGDPPKEGHQRKAGDEQSGIFYRQNLPYVAETLTGDFHTEAVVYSPSLSPTYFLPISRTFFSNNSAEFTFTEGIPTHYKQETQGELVALLKIPADVIAAYFTAVGSAFDSFKTRDSKQAEVLAGSMKLELAKQKYDACVVAIKANDSVRIKELKCGE